MKHRHLTYASDSAAEDLPSAALLDILDRGDLADWQPIAAAIKREPHGPLSERIAHLIEAHPMYGTTALWRAWIERARWRLGEPGALSEKASLASLRRRMGLTQAQLAERVGMSQSDLSKFERRGDVRISTLKSYLGGLGGRLRLLAYVGSSTVELRVGAPHGGEARPTSPEHEPRTKTVKSAPTSDPERPQ